MDTEHDQDALLRRADHDVVREDGFGVFQVQLLEGPTDNPIRVIGPGGVDYRESYTFGIEGEGWNILVDILGLPGQPADRSTVSYHLSCLISLVRHFPRSFGLLEDPVRVPRA
jgi:hypothetical protein